MKEVAAKSTHLRDGSSPYFSPIGNVHTPSIRIPPCKVCGNPSLGGVIVEMEPSSPVGQPTFTADFFCGDHVDGSFATMSDRLFPVYRILSIIEPWRLKIQRLPREQQEARMRE